MAQPRPAFSFAPPTAPTIPLTATKGVFTFGSTARFDLATQGPANLRVTPRAPGKATVAKPALSAPLNGPKPHPARCKPHGVTPSLGSLQSDISSGPPCQVEDSSVGDSEQASDASTVPLLVTLLSLIRGLRPDLSHRRRKVRVCKTAGQCHGCLLSTLTLGSIAGKPDDTHLGVPGRL